MENFFFLLYFWLKEGKTIKRLSAQIFRHFLALFTSFSSLFTDSLIFRNFLPIFRGENPQNYPLVPKSWQSNTLRRVLLQIYQPTGKTLCSNVGYTGKSLYTTMFGVKNYPLVCISARMRSPTQRSILSMLGKCISRYIHRSVYEHVCVCV